MKRFTLLAVLLLLTACRGVGKTAAELVSLSPSYITSVPDPKETDLVSFYNAHEAQFDAPEYRTISWIVIDNKTIAERYEVSDADIKTA